MPAHAQRAILLGILSFFMAWVVQAFFASVMLDIVDAVFICYAMDKDTQSVTRMEVHEVFSQVSPGFALRCAAHHPFPLPCQQVFMREMASCGSLPSSGMCMLGSMVVAGQVGAIVVLEVGACKTHMGGQDSAASDAARARAQVPVGVAVQQPGGEYAYGAPIAGGYVPPSHPAAGSADYGGNPPPQLARPRQYGVYDSSARV
jgi:hypothetical protein